MKRGVVVFVILIFVFVACSCSDEHFLRDSLPKREHVHKYEEIELKESTCETEGRVDHYECSCGKLFVLENGEYKEITLDDLIIPKRDHNIIKKRQDEVIHLQYSQCDKCERIIDYYLPILNITCSEDLGMDYIDCEISVDNCLSEYQFSDAVAQIKIRGNWTATKEKKPYRIKFDTKKTFLGLNNNLVAKSWVLLADFADKSMLRNAIALYISSIIFGERYYSSDCCFVDVYINNEYQGVYLLAEQQQINNGRVEIYENKKDETNNIGFFLELDQYYMDEDPSIVFEIDYNEIPFFNGYVAKDSFFIKQYVIKNDIKNSNQRDFISDRLQKIWSVAYDALYGNHLDLSSCPYKTIDENGEIIDDFSIENSFEALNRIIDVDSLVDTYLLNEIIQDMDFGSSSFYLSLDMSENGNKKLTFQAPWDFDWCFGNSINNIHQLYIGNCLINEPNYGRSNPWLLLVSNAKWFWELLSEKWKELSDHNLKKAVLQLICFFTDNYGEYTEREFERWPGKENLIVWCSSENTLSARTQKDDVENLIHYIDRRFSWLDYYFEDISRVNLFVVE